MVQNKLFNNFQSVATAEVMDDKQMNMLEAGGCSEGCKKSCRPGGQNDTTKVRVVCDTEDLYGISEVLESVGEM